MTPEHLTPNTTDAEPAGVANIEPKRRKGGRKDIGPLVGAKNHKSVRDDERSQGEKTGQAQAEQEQEVDGDLGVSHDFKDEQANANYLPAPIDADNATLPASYERAKQALAACESMDECKDWEDKMAALAAYGRMAGDTELEKQRHCASGHMLHGVPVSCSAQYPARPAAGPGARKTQVGTHPSFQMPRWSPRRSQ